LKEKFYLLKQSFIDEWYNSHMDYLLIEKTDDIFNNFSAELITRNNHHGIKENLSEKEAMDLAKKCLSLRFSSLNTSDSYLTNTFNSKKNIIDLGNQSINNCIATNLFATFEVLNHRNRSPAKDFEKKVKEFKSLLIRKYRYFRYNFFPFEPINTITKEIEKLKDEKI
jgi:hypothetical protein